MNAEIGKINRIEAKQLIARKCKEFREKASISVENMAKLVNVSRQTIYSFEKGELDSMTILYYYLILGVKI